MGSGKGMMRFLTLVCFLLTGLLSASAEQREYDVPAAVEMHIYLSIIPGKQQELERLYREEFYPAVRHQPGFISSELLRKPNSNDFILRHTFRSEELRMKWTSSPERQRVWPALLALTKKATWEGYGVVYPPRR